MEELKELTDILGDGFLPVGETTVGERAKRLHKYLLREEKPNNSAAARYLSMDAATSSFRKVKHHLKLALINGITAVHPGEPVPENRAEAALWSWKRIALGKTDHRLLGPWTEKAFDPWDLYAQFALPEAALQRESILAASGSTAVNLGASRGFSEDFLHELAFHGQKVFAALFHTSFMQNQRMPTEKIEAFSRSAIKDFSPFKHRFTDERINYNIYAIEANYHFSVFDYERILANADEAISRFRKMDSANREKIILICNIHKLRAYLHLGQFAAGFAIAKDLVQSGVNDPLNLSLIQELTILLCLRTGHYQAAYDFFTTVDIKKYKKNISTTHGETIEIFLGYLQFLISVGQVTTGTDEGFFKKFRLRKFLNTFNHANKEKSLRNVQIFILKVVYLVVNSKDGGLLDELDGLQKYTQRHLRDQKLRRSKLFVQALLLIAKKGNSQETVREAEERYLKKLDELPLGETHQHTFVEIIRYDYLWSIVKERIAQ